MDHLIVAQFIWNCYINILIVCDAGLLLVYKVLNDRILFLLLYDLEEASLNLVKIISDKRNEFSEILRHSQVHQVK